MGRDHYKKTKPQPTRYSVALLSLIYICNVLHSAPAAAPEALKTEEEHAACSAEHGAERCAQFTQILHLASWEEGRQNLTMAKVFYRALCDQGDGRGCLELARIYASIDPKSKDIFELASRACAHGYGPKCKNKFMPPKTEVAKMEPTTPAPAAPTTPPPVAAAPTAPPPVAAAPTTPPPVATAPTTPPPVAAAPTTPPPVAAAPTTPPPVAAAPTTPPPVAAAPTTPPPVAAAPTTPPPVAAAPTTPPPVAAAPTTPPPVAAAPTTPPPVAAAPTTPPPVAAAPTTPPPVAAAPVTPPPAGAAPVTPPAQEPAKAAEAPKTEMAKVEPPPPPPAPVEVPKRDTPFILKFLAFNNGTTVLGRLLNEEPLIFGAEGYLLIIFALLFGGLFAFKFAQPVPLSLPIIRHVEKTKTYPDTLMILIFAIWLGLALFNGLFGAFSPAGRSYLFLQCFWLVVGNGLGLFVALSMIPKRICVTNDDLVIQSPFLRYRRFKMKEIIDISLVPTKKILPLFKSVWIGHCSFSRPGILVRDSNGKGFFVAVDNPEKAKDSLRHLCGLSPEVTKAEPFVAVKKVVIPVELPTKTLVVEDSTPKLAQDLLGSIQPPPAPELEISEAPISEIPTSASTEGSLAESTASNFSAAPEPIVAEYTPPENTESMPSTETTPANPVTEIYPAPSTEPVLYEYSPSDSPVPVAISPQATTPTTTSSSHEETVVAPIIDEEKSAA